MADGIRSALENTILDEILWTEKAKHIHLDKLVLPQKIVNVQALGKKILIGLEDGTLIVNELKMSGYWSWEDDSPAHTRLTFLFRYPHAPMVQYEFYFVCVRNFAITKAYFTEAEKKAFFESIGPDILQHALTTPISKNRWRERFLKKTIKRPGSKPFLICDALLEQKIFSGLGNYLRADILWLARISPLRPAQELTEDEYERLRIAAHTLIRKAYEAGGTTVRTYRDVDGDVGHYQCLVYMQFTDPLGNKVVRSRFPESKWTKRTVHWVPSLQK
jgi:formamidopyrimidine-DNA glycosylase